MDERRRKLRFRAWRRGFLEMDILMGTFADRHIGALSDAQLDALEALLQEQDQDVWAWLTGQAPPPPEHDPDLLGLISAFRHFLKNAKDDPTHTALREG